MAQQLAKLALFGQPVKHSLSPKIHQQFAAQFKLRIDYSLIESTAEQLTEKINHFFDSGGIGANITVPHKQAAGKLVSKLTPNAQAANAINTIFRSNRQRCGDNTDGAGLLNDLKQKNIALKARKILIIGAGGAAQGIVPILLQQQPKELHIQNRTQHKAERLAKQHPPCQAVTITDDNHRYDLIINATSIGHLGQVPPINKQWFKPQTVAYDLSYGKAAQPFIQFTKPLTAQSHDGQGMLICQAALSFQRWFGKMPTVQAIKLQ